MVVPQAPFRRPLTFPITQKGQVTMPAEIRLLLGVGPKDRIQYTVDGDGRVWVSAVESSVERLRGKYKPVAGQEHVSFEQMADDAMQDIADETMREMSAP